MKSLTHVLEKYGNSAHVCTKDSDFQIKCFINRLRRRTSTYLPKECDQFKDSNEYFLYIGPPNLQLTRGDRISSSNTIYVVESSEKLESKDISYIWAVMSKQ